MKSKALLGSIIAVVAVIIVVFVIGKVMSKKAAKGGADVGQTEVVLLDGNYELDGNASTLGWSATKVGGAHNGNVRLTIGNVTVVDGSVSAGSITAAMPSISVGDLTDPGMNTKLVAHLNSPDFFDTEKYPSATLSIAQWKKSNNGFLATTDITIKGVTKRVEVPVIVSVTDSEITMDGLFTIDQSDFSIVAGTLADAAIKDEFELSFKAVFAKK